MRPRFFESEINDVPADLSLLRFERIPVPAEISNRSIRKIGLRGRLRQLRDRAHFRPLQRRIGRLSIESVEGCDSHIWIDQHVIDGNRAHDHSVALCVGEATKKYKYGQR